MYLAGFYLHIPADLVWETTTFSPQLHGLLHYSPTVVTPIRLKTPKVIKIFA